MGWTSEDNKERGPKRDVFSFRRTLGTVPSVEMVDLACMLHAACPACLLDRWTVLVWWCGLDFRYIVASLLGEQPALQLMCVCPIAAGDWDPWDCVDWQDWTVDTA